MDILYSEKALKYLRKLAKTNKKSAKRIIDEIEEYALNPVGHFDVKILKGKLGNFKRLRVGDYRILFDEENHVLNVYDIKHRKEAYR